MNVAKKLFCLFIVLYSSLVNAQDNDWRYADHGVLSVNLGYTDFRGEPIPGTFSAVFDHGAILGVGYTYFLNRVIGVGVKANVCYESEIVGTEYDYYYSGSGYGSSYHSSSSYVGRQNITIPFIGPSFTFKGFAYSPKDRLSVCVTPGYMLRRMAMRYDKALDSADSDHILGCDFDMSYRVFNYEKCDLGLSLSYFYGKVFQNNYKIIGKDDTGKDYILDSWTRDSDFGRGLLSRLSLSLCFGLNL